MADIFLSYAREDREKARVLARTLFAAALLALPCAPVSVAQSVETLKPGVVKVKVEKTDGVSGVEAATEEAARVTDAQRGEGAPSWADDEKLNRRILIEGGEFLMGSPGRVGSDSERPPHRVRLRSFYLQEHEVTNEEYRRFKPDHPFPQGKERHPVVEVSWQEASDYAQWLGGRLPTEAEWEYAARAGTRTRWSFGDDEEEIGDYAWVDGGFGGTSHTVGEKRPNPWGLHDMHGNVYEWVADWYGAYPEASQVDPLNTDSSSGWRVFRGGSFRLSAVVARSANRSRDVPVFRYDYVGIRVVLPAPCRDSTVDP